MWHIQFVLLNFFDLCMGICGNISVVSEKMPRLVRLAREYKYVLLNTISLFAIKSVHWIIALKGNVEKELFTLCMYVAARFMQNTG